MKKTYLIIIFIITFLSAISCSYRKQSTSFQTDLITINLEKDYPTEKIFLQDIANITYLPLETKDSALLDDNCLIYSSQAPIIIANNNHGSVFIFNEKGKYLSSFNHTGNGPGEYLAFSNLYLSSDKNKITIVEDIDEANPNHLIYDLNGNFKQKIKRPNLKTIDCFLPIDHHHIIALDYTGLSRIFPSNKYKIIPDANRIDSCNQTPYYLLKAQTLEVIDSLPIRLPFRISPFFMAMPPNSMFKILMFSSNPFIFDGIYAWCNDVASDTIYTFNVQEGLRPQILKRPTYTKITPRTTLITDAISDQYLLFHKLIMTSDFNFEELFGINKFPMKNLLVNRKTGKILQPELINKEWETQLFNKVLLRNNPNYHEKNLAFLLSMPSLKEALKNGFLNDKLKKIVEEAEEEDNPILMRISLK